MCGKACLTVGKIILREAAPPAKFGGIASIIIVVALYVTRNSGIFLSSGDLRGGCGVPRTVDLARIIEM
jgi:hypothetical protein